MAYILCPKHGGHGAASVCAHVASMVTSTDAEQPSNAERLYPVGATFQQTTVGPTWLCAACAAEHHVPADGLELDSEAGLEQFWSVIGFTPVCPKCFEERYGRAA